MPWEFTVGIPTHNRRETVLLAVESALEQTRPPARVCVIADGCTDGTQAALAELGDARIELIDLPKAPGYGYAHRNAVLERARGQAVAWLADDDLWLPDHLERAGELLDAGAEIVNSMACMVGADGALVPCGAHWRAPIEPASLAGDENRSPSSAISHLADVALAAGGWSGQVEGGGDWDLWKRIVQSGARSEMVPAPTVLFFCANERGQRWEDRVTQNASYLSRIRDPAELGSLRAELAYGWAAGGRAELMATRDQVAALTAERDEIRADRDRVVADRERVAAERDAILGSAWWRLRERLEPVLRLRRGSRRPG
jgi:glycosyltransferase involved in cell wall biosynthesis